MYRDIADLLRTSAAGEGAIASKPVGFPTECLPRVVRETVKTCAVAHQVPQALTGCEFESQQNLDWQTDQIKREAERTMAMERPQLPNQVDLQFI